MSIRNAALIVILGVPAVLLLVLGPRGRHDIPGDRVVIRYWEKWSGVEGQAMKRIVDRFNETVGADDGIWVDYCAISNVDQRTLIATAGGDPPDVAGLYDHIVAQFADQGALLELDELAVEYGIRASQFKPIWWRIGQYNDHLYALPSAPYTIALYYNRRLFANAGLDPDHPPETIAELSTCAERLTIKDDTGRITQAGFIPAPALLGWWHWVWPYFFDARPWDGERFNLDTPQVMAAMTWIAHQRQKLGVPAALAFEATAGAIEGTQNPFLAERLAMVFQGPWMTNWINTYTPDLDYGVAPFPSVSKERQNVFASADVFAIPRGSRHPREAMRFIAYVLEPEVMHELCKAHGKVSPFRDVDESFFADHPNKFIRVFDDMALSEYTFGHPKMPMFKEASIEMLFMLENILQGVRTPSDAIEFTQGKINAIVDQHQAMAAKRRSLTLQSQAVRPPRDAVGLQRNAIERWQDTANQQTNTP